MSKATCPECAAELELEAGTEENEIIVCPDCGVDLEGRRGLGGIGIR